MSEVYAEDNRCAACAPEKEVKETLDIDETLIAEEPEDHMLVDAKEQDE